VKVTDDCSAERYLGVDVNHTEGTQCHETEYGMSIAPACARIQTVICKGLYNVLAITDSHCVFTLSLSQTLSAPVLTPWQNLLQCEGKVSKPDFTDFKIEFINPQVSKKNKKIIVQVDEEDPIIECGFPTKDPKNTALHVGCTKHYSDSLIICSNRVLMPFPNESPMVSCDYIVLCEISPITMIITWRIV